MFCATLEHQMLNNDNRRYFKYLEKQENKNAIKRTKFQGHYNIGQVLILSKCEGNEWA